MLSRGLIHGLHDSYLQIYRILIVLYIQIRRRIGVDRRQTHILRQLHVYPVEVLDVAIALRTFADFSRGTR